MRINEITLTGFRNYDKQSLNPGSGINFIVGQNGVGKTNFLEAVYVLGLSRSYKAEDADLVMHGRDFAKVTAAIEGKNGASMLTVILSEVGKKAVVNHTEIKRLSDYVGILKVVAFTPDSLDLVKGSPVGRRAFLDVLLGQSDKQYLAALSRYKTVLKQRNELLKQAQIRQTIDETLLGVFDAQLAEPGDIIKQKREVFLRSIGEASAIEYRLLTTKNETLGLVYEPSAPDSMLKLLETKRKTDLSQGTTNFGPHRDDFRFTVAGIDANAVASQGEVRLMVLSVTIALIAYLTTLTGDTPVVLLDDVLSELDQEKQNRLIKRLLQYQAQTIVTATALTELDDRVFAGAHTYHVESGIIREERQHG